MRTYKIRTDLDFGAGHSRILKVISYRKIFTHTCITFLLNLFKIVVIPQDTIPEKIKDIIIRNRISELDWRLPRVTS